MIERWGSRQGAARWRGRIAAVGVLAIALVLQTSASPAAKKEEPAPDAREISAFIEKWRCPVAAYLRGIQQLPRTNDDRYLILWAKRRPAFYVQCIFHDDDRQIYCEAASGFYRYADRVGSFATPARLDALAGLGFSTDGSKGNWAQDGDFHSVDETATHMLETLARVFAANGNDVLEWSAPLLSKRHSNRIKIGAECAPGARLSHRRFRAESASSLRCISPLCPAWGVKGSTPLTRGGASRRQRESPSHKGRAPRRAASPRHFASHQRLTLE